jgi:hypothetical protein
VQQLVVHLHTQHKQRQSRVSNRSKGGR